MLVALDARLVGYAAGIARYVELLADALEQIGRDHHHNERYLVLRGRRTRERQIGGAAAIQRRVLTPPHHPLERWTLPVELVARPPWPDLLHSVDHVAPAWGPWRSVVTIHDLAFLLYPQTHAPASRAYYAAAGESARQAERVIAVSQRTASDAVRLLGLDPARVRVVHEAAAPVFTPRPAHTLPPLARRLGLPEAVDRPYVLFVSTLEPRKNVPLLLEAFALVRRQLDVTLVLAGERGWMNERIAATHARLGLDGAARFVGRLAEDDLAVLYSHARVFVLPSLYEGFGLGVLEAMACGAPVVCSNAGPLPEVAGDAALLLPPEDPAAWAAAMLRVLTDDELAMELRARGLARARLFSWQRAAEQTREVYREALLA